MPFTSFYFLCLYTGILILYYLIPRKLQWILLIAASISYYLLSGNGMLILYPIAACGIAYTGIQVIAGSEDIKKRRLSLFVVVFLLIGILFLLKYINFIINTFNGIGAILGLGESLIKGLGFLVPLGISFYTFSILGYVIDVYNGIAKPQKNLFKMVLYGMYFPAILSGPILKYREDGEHFFSPHSFDYEQVTFGLQRILWGFFKTLVISERMNLVVNTVYDNYTQYTGVYIWVATVCYAFQLYTNFSGCMDIALGMSQTFGIQLPENFNTPFFSKNISEYWRRWHITLGVWMKEYVFYPLLRSQAFVSLGEKCKGRFGKKKGKQFVIFTAMLVLWFTVGIWHGGDWKYVIGSGLLHWFYIVSGELFTPFFHKCMNKCHIKSDGRWVNAFRIIRTFFLVNIGFVFFRAASTSDALHMLVSAVKLGNVNALFDGSLFLLGLDKIEFAIATVSLLILLVVSVLQQKEDVRKWLSRKNIVIRWMVWYALLFYVILLGYYGPGYNAAEFIYQGF